MSSTAGGVPDRVREPLFDDPVGGPVSLRRERPGPAAQLHRHGRSRDPELLDQAGDRGHPPGGGTRAAQHAEDLVQLGDAGPNRRREPGDGRPLRRGQLSHLKRRRLQRGEAETTAKRVVHVAGDPQPLG
jgi:hypothetical protein